MMILRTFSGQEYILESDEAQNIVQLKHDGNVKALLRLRCGAFVNTAAIESIAPPPLIATYDGHPLSKDGRSFMRDGQRIWLDDFSKIEYLPDPRYDQLGEAQKQLQEPAPKPPEERRALPQPLEGARTALVKGMGMLLPGARAEIAEDVARQERKDKT